VKVSWVAAVMLLAGAVTATADELDGRPITAVSVTGLRTIAEAVVLNQIEAKPGGRYSAAAIAEDVVRLERLKVFSDVSIVPAPNDTGVRLDIVVVETLRILPAVSIGVSDESGTSIGPAIKVLSIAGRPHEISASVRFGGEGLVELSDTSPYLTNRRLWFSNKLSIRDRTNGLDDFPEHSLDYDGRVGLRLMPSLKTGAIVQAFTLRSGESGVTLSPDDSDAFFGSGGIVEYDTRDSWTTPTRGWLNSFDAVWRVGAGDYGTMNFDARRYQPITPKQTLLATALLTLQSGVRGEDIPGYVDYALGGANSVRGWEFASRRGKNQLIMSVEHRYTLVPTSPFRVKGLNLYGGIALAVFADGGSAWNEAGDWTDNAIGGAGIGLRIFVPFVDVIRIDLAVGHGSRVMVGINEKAVAQRNRVR
jgi:outer membrane protein assembly factor BamA